MSILQVSWSIFDSGQIIHLICFQKASCSRRDRFITQVLLGYINYWCLHNHLAMEHLEEWVDRCDQLNIKTSGKGAKVHVLHSRPEEDLPYNKGFMG